MKKSLCIISAVLSLLSAEASATCNADITITKPDVIYIDHGNGTVTDKQTGLMWMKCTQGLSGALCATGTATAMNWKQALEAAQTANAGAGTLGYTNWRLPNIAELRTLRELACVSPSINTTLFPSTVIDFYKGSSYWTASPDTSIAAPYPFIWGIDFYFGIDGYIRKDDNWYVRLVRGGQ